MVAMLFEVAHGVKFAIDGVGMERIEVAGDILDILSRVNITILNKYVPVLSFLFHIG
jgi:hypothetical protein